MKNLIKKILKEEIKKGELKKSIFCNKMTINTYEDGIKKIEDYLGTKEENPKEWEKIEDPLFKWKKYTKEIRREKLTDRMTGDSEFDESNTWWSAIESTFCK